VRTGQLLQTLETNFRGMPPPQRQCLLVAVAKGLVGARYRNRRKMPSATQFGTTRLCFSARKCSCPLAFDSMTKTCTIRAFKGSNVINRHCSVWSKSQLDHSRKRVFLGDFLGELICSSHYETSERPPGAGFGPPLLLTGGTLRSAVMVGEDGRFSKPLI